MTNYKDFLHNLLYSKVRVGESDDDGLPIFVQTYPLFGSVIAIGISIISLVVANTVAKCLH